MDLNITLTSGGGENKERPLESKNEGSEKIKKLSVFSYKRYDRKARRKRLRYPNKKGRSDNFCGP